ncbi:hypothetical protein [Pseudomonas fluorescens]|uniref:hypothetical protein n=1 Tax=Pseudomonas fluorescens TaxID=294 RepID=UPI00123EDD59|nr:hypothetical protein [Pseudomonas fluorescens]
MMVIHTVGLAALDKGRFSAAIRRHQTEFCTGFREPLMAQAAKNAAAGLQTDFSPCKGILQARLRRHYREIFAGVVRRIGSWRGREGGFFEQSEVIQGFGSWKKNFADLSAEQMLFKKRSKLPFFTTSCVLQ